MKSKTLFEKIWDDHVIKDLGEDNYLILVDRLMLHEITGGIALRSLDSEKNNLLMPPHHIFSVPDHSVSTKNNRKLNDSTSSSGEILIASLRDCSQKYGIEFFENNSPEHGIVHVISPQLGITLPGLTLVCGDSHTCSVGALGTLGWGIGSSEIKHVLATNTIEQKKPQNMRIQLNGSLPIGVSLKDISLFIISKIGANGAKGYCLEFAGDVVKNASIEERLTLCNMATECSANYALIAPDAKTFQFLKGRKYSPKDAKWDLALDYWKNLTSDLEAIFDKDIVLNCSELTPYITWGTSPMHACSINDNVSNLEEIEEETTRQAAKKALQYMDLHAGQKISEIKIDVAFIGSCTNSRISDLRIAAEILQGNKLAPWVKGMCTPGSMEVKYQAEQEGLDKIFIESGFDWRMPGCSNCSGREGNIWDNLRVVSTTNRNFENRQGHRTKTHLASPATVAASAITGFLTNPNLFLVKKENNMQKFEIEEGILCPLVQDNIDTDAIIPVSENTRMNSSGFDDALFAEWRYLDRVKRIPNPHFILNKNPFQKSTILLAGKNFGCGSSRESAVWALRDYGFRAIIAESYSRIFFNNCIENGILPIQITMDKIKTLESFLNKEFENPILKINLINQKIQFGKNTFDFLMDSRQRSLLLKGVNKISNTLGIKNEISNFILNGRIKRSWSYLS